MKTVLPYLRLKRTWLMLIVILYTALGFFALPYLLKTQGAKQLHERFGVRMQIQKVYFNPYTFFLSFQQLSLKDAGGKELLTLPYLHADLELDSIFKGYLHLQSVTVERLHLYPALDAEAQLNYSRIFAPETEKAPPQQEAGNGIFGLVIDKLSITKLRTTFSDSSQQTPYRKTFGPISYEGENFSTLQNDNSSTLARFNLGELGVLELRGRLSLNPFNLETRINHRKVDLSNVHTYIQRQLPATLTSGTLEYKTDLRMRHNGGLEVSLSKLRGKLDALGLEQNGSALLRAQKIGFDLDTFHMKLQNKALALKTGTMHTRFEQTAFFDRTLQPAFIHRMDKAALRVEGFGLNDPFGLEGNATLNSGGSVAFNGEFALPPKRFEGDFLLQSVALAPYTPYLQPATNLEIASGKVWAEGSLALESKESLDLRGDTLITLRDFALRNGAARQKLLTLEELRIDRLRYEHKKRLLNPQKITLKQPRFYIYKDKNGATNLSRLTKPPKQNAPKAKETKGRSADIAIDDIRVADGEIHFQDLSTAPPSRLDVTEIVLHSGALGKGKLSAMELQALINSFAKLDARISTEAFAPLKNTTVEAKLDRFNLQNLSGYSYKGIGQKIEKGKLTVDMRYTLKDSLLQAKNELLIDELVLSPYENESGADSLPTGLAIALLQDLNKQISLDLSLSNRVDDPDFSVSGVVVQALMNIVTKAAASPFTLLGSVLGMDAQELRYLEFAAGEAALTRKQQEKLDLLLEALKKRKQLHLSICGALHKQADTAALQAAMLQQTLPEKPVLIDLEALAQGEKIALEALRKEAQEQNATINEERYKALLQEALQKTFPVSKARIEKLARQRAENIKAYLLEMGAAPERVAICDTPRENSLKATFELSAP